MTQHKDRLTETDLEKIFEIDHVVDDLIDATYRESLADVLWEVLNVLDRRLSLSAAFLQYVGPRTFDDKPPVHINVFSDETSDTDRKRLARTMDDYRDTVIVEEGIEAPPLRIEWDEGEGTHLTAIPMHLAHEVAYVGILGVVSPNATDDFLLRLLSQVASRVDTYIRSRIMSNERHIVLNQINKLLDRKGIHGIDDALLLLTRLIGSDIGAVVYLEDVHDPAVHPSMRRVGLVYVENDRIIKKPDILAILNNRLGGPMIEYDMNHIDDSRYGMRVMGILCRDPASGEEKRRYFQCMDLVNRYGENQHNIGKLFLIGSRQLDYTDLNVMEAVALQIDSQISHYHEQKKALGRSLHPDQVDFFLKYPKIARWFFENPRDELIAMVFSDICGYTALTRKMGDPRKTIDVAKKWILKEKQLTLKHGGFFDKEVGDCAVSLFGPPFGAISLDALSKVESIDDIQRLVQANKYEPHIYAYHAVMYALDSLRAVRKFWMGEDQLNLAIGIEVGWVALGDLTGDIGKLTAMGDAMNLAARLQGIAGEGEIVVGPACADLLETYRKEAYLAELPFDIEKGGEASLKGYDEPVPYYKISRRNDVHMHLERAGGKLHGRRVL